MPEPGYPLSPHHHAMHSNEGQIRAAAGGRDKSQKVLDINAEPEQAWHTATRESGARAVPGWKVGPFGVGCPC